MNELELMKAAVENENLNKALENVGDKEGVREAFRKYGVELTEDENGNLEAQAGDNVVTTEGELGEEDLDEVAGGRGERYVVNRKRVGPLIAEHIYIYRHGVLVGCKVRIKWAL